MTYIHCVISGEECKGERYDPRAQLCCGDVLYKLSEFNVCCGGKTAFMYGAAKPAYSGCCNGVPYVMWDSYCCREKTIYANGDYANCMPTRKAPTSL